MSRPRTAVVAGIVSFCALQIALSNSIESDTLPIRDPIFTEKLSLLQKHPEFWSETTDPARPRLLVIGSSRTQLLLDARRLEPAYHAFNFGCSSCGPIMQLLYFQRLIDAGLRAELLLIEIHPALLADLAEPFELRWLHSHRLRPGESERLHILGCGPDAISANRCPWFQASSHYRLALLNEFAPDLLPGSQAVRRNRTSDASGFVASIDANSTLRRELLANAKAEYQPTFVNYRPGGPATAALRQMITLALANRIRPILFVAPESTEFQSWYGTAGNARIRAFCETLPKESGVPLLNSRDWLPDAEFVDGHHVTPRGATRFTERLHAELPNLVNR